MRSNEKVVLAAVQADGYILEYASEELKNNEKVVLAAVQQNGGSLQYASEDVQNRIRSCMSEFGCTSVEAAGALAEPRLVLVSASTVDSGGYGVGAMVVNTTNLN